MAKALVDGDLEAFVSHAHAFEGLRTSDRKIGRQLQMHFGPQGKGISSRASLTENTLPECLLHCGPVRGSSPRVLRFRSTVGTEYPVLFAISPISTPSSCRRTIIAAGGQGLGLDTSIPTTKPRSSFFFRRSNSSIHRCLTSASIFQ